MCLNWCGLRESNPRLLYLGQAAYLGTKPALRVWDFALNDLVSTLRIGASGGTRTRIS